jgi:hypothetical protein
LTQIEQASGGLHLALRSFAPGWVLAECSDNPALGLKDEILGRSAVLLTYPLSRDVGCRLTRTLTLPADASASLRLDVGYFPGGDWELIVRANDQELLRQVVGKQSAPDGWLHVEIDLAAFAGQSTRLELLNQPNGWAWEGAYWDTLELVTQ